MADGSHFTLAGLWENWRDPESGEWIRTFTIITTEANSLVGRLHDRMPVIITEADRDRWLNGPDPGGLLQPYPADLMTMWPVSPKVNSPKNDSPDLLEAVADAVPGVNDVPRANEGDAVREPVNSE